jgi:hypothetical protein
MEPFVASKVREQEGSITGERTINGNESSQGAQLKRGLLVRNTAQLLVDADQVQHLVRSIEAIKITDVYLYVAPNWCSQRGPEIAILNAIFYTAGVRVWATAGNVHCIDDFEAEDVFIQSLLALGNYNEGCEPEGRFYGFQADIQPQDTPDHADQLQNGTPNAKLTVIQRTQRDILMHKWLNVLTRASNLVRSYGMPFSNVVPWWLHDLEGEEITVPWVSVNEDRSTPRTCIMNLIMPLCDEYAIITSATDPGETIKHMMHQLRYACDEARGGHPMPRVVGIVSAEKCAGPGASYAETSGKAKKEVVISDMCLVERTLEKYPLFGGMAIRDWVGWNLLPP